MLKNMYKSSLEKSTLIYDLLMENKGKGYTKTELTNITKLNLKTVSSHIDSLLEYGKIKKFPNLKDNRGFLYYVEGE